MSSTMSFGVSPHLVRNSTHRPQLDPGGLVAVADIGKGSDSLFLAQGGENNSSPLPFMGSRNERQKEVARARRENSKTLITETLDFLR
jgi:hypothetical protein